jgi:HSP20 family protein
MPIAHWNPVRELLALQERMNRLIEHTLTGSRSSTQEGIPEGGTWAPAVDLYELDRTLILKMELPEVEQESIQLRIVNNRITVKGERRLKEAVSQKQFHRTERAFGPFSRTFSLPNNIDPDKVKAELKRGVLKVTMYKREDELSKQIPINS